MELAIASILGGRLVPLAFQIPEPFVLQSVLLDAPVLEAGSFLAIKVPDLVLWSVLGFFYRLLVIREPGVTLFL